MLIYELIHRCPYCGREADRSGLAFAENPYCNECLPERLAKAQAEIGPGHWVLDGEKHMRFVPDKPADPT